MLARVEWFVAIGAVLATVITAAPTAGNHSLIEDYDWDSFKVSVIGILCCVVV